jgi:hypothetical protein
LWIRKPKKGTARFFEKSPCPGRGDLHRLPSRQTNLQHFGAGGDGGKVSEVLWTLGWSVIFPKKVREKS